MGQKTNPKIINAWENSDIGALLRGDFKAFCEIEKNSSAAKLVQGNVGEALAKLGEENRTLSTALGIETAKDGYKEAFKAIEEKVDDGDESTLTAGEKYLTKTICVMPRQKLSIQSHNYRSEHWVVLEGKALVLLNDKEYVVNSGESIDIPLKAKHSLQNPCDEELKIIEVQKGDYISEDDIIRYSDLYGRC